MRARATLDRLLPERGDPRPERPGGLSDENPASGSHCEYADGFCFPQGSRTVTDQRSVDHGHGRTLINASPTGTRMVTWTSTVCPTRRTRGRTEAGTTRRRSSTSGRSPTGRPYPQIQFETDIGGSSFLCDTATGAGCTVPPISANFYPYWSLSPQFSALGSKTTSCVWNFGGQLPNTVKNFGRTPSTARPT